MQEAGRQVRQGLHSGSVWLRSDTSGGKHSAVIVTCFTQSYKEKTESADKDVDKSPPAQKTREGRTLKLSEDRLAPVCVCVYAKDKEDDRSAQPKREIENAAES